MLGFTVVTSIGFIILPLATYRKQGLRTPHALPMLAYFSFLGLGYISIEVVLIQRFTLFIGYPTTAITITIFSMLFFSALGSLVSERSLFQTPRLLRYVLAAISILIVIYDSMLPILFESLLKQPDGIRVLLSIFLIAPLGFLMGIPFPTGLRQIGKRTPNLIPWVWGVNGVFSVLGSTLVIVISIGLNYTVAFLSVAVLYSSAMIVSGALWKAQTILLNSLKLLMSKNMAQIDHTKGDKMSTHVIHILAVIANNESAKLVKPGKGAFTRKTMLVNV